MSCHCMHLFVPIMHHTFALSHPAGFGFKPQSGAAMLASLDDRVADADAKLRDFMAEIESIDADEAAENQQETTTLTRSKMPGFVSGGHVLPAKGGGMWFFMSSMLFMHPIQSPFDNSELHNHPLENITP